jgi:hypothetical protein
MRTIMISVLTILFMTGMCFAQDTQHHAQMKLNCQECHSCAKPTYEKPCLKLLPEFTREGVTIFNTAAEAPEIIKIDTLEKIYGPTIFTHKLHAEMSFMSGGCKSCHHFNPPGRVLACINCHEPSVIRDDLSKPGLKGAYHRQCLNCHREWSHSTNCIVCHELAGEDTTPATIESKAGFEGKTHPKIETPKKVVYNVDYEDGPVVTFYHNDHTDLFNIKCESCHQNETCARCHDAQKKTADVEKEPHENCIACHEDAIEENCEKCHGRKEKPSFNHAKTGWPLNRFHKDLYCTECHGHQDKFSKLNKNCNSCHKAWKSSNFNHKVTGIALDETHIENDCVSCHPNRNFAIKPICTECHDDMKYPANIPGRKVSLK